MAWIVKMMLSIIIDIIDFAFESTLALSPVWNTIQLVLMMILWPTGSTFVWGAIEFLPVVSGFIPGATIAGIISGMTGMD